MHSVISPDMFAPRASHFAMGHSSPIECMGNTVCSHTTLACVETLRKMSQVSGVFMSRLEYYQALVTDA